jgi:GAF domain-containing protein
MFTNFLITIPSKLRHVIILIGIVTFFVLSLLPNNTALVIIKILFFLAIISFVYLIYQQHDEQYVSEEPIPEYEDEKQDWLRIEDDQDVEELFQTFIDSTLQLVKKILVSDTVILLFANYKKKEFTIRHVVTNHESLLIAQKSFNISSGLPSLIIKNRTPLIENHLPEGSEILPYYKNGEAPPNSFMGIPVFFKDHLIGVLCADTSVEEAYSKEDLEIIEHFSQLISVQLFGSNKLYEYESENWLVNTLFQISKEIHRVQSVDELWQFLLKKIPSIISCDRISVSKKLNEKEGEIISIAGGTGNLKSGKVFPLSEGIVGWVIRKNQSLLVDDFSVKENYVPRFYSDETPAKDYFSLLSLPISTEREVVAAICLESIRSKNFKEQHKRILHTICNHAATIHFTTQTLDHLRETSYKDWDTKLENVNAFQFILPKQIKQASKFHQQLNLLFIKLYFQLKEDSPDLFKKVIKEFLSLTLPILDETDYIFRIFPDIFVIVNMYQKGDGIQEFASKLMEKLRLKKIWADGNAYDFYTSMGIVNHRYLKMNVDHILKIGEEAIKQARLKGPNHIAVYQEVLDDSGEQLQMWDGQIEES